MSGGVKRKAAPLARSASDVPLGEARESQVHHLCIRWSLWDAGGTRPAPPTEAVFSTLHERLNATFAKLCDKWIFQLERGAGDAPAPAAAAASGNVPAATGRLHYQCYVHLARGEKRRPAALAAALNAEYFGIDIRPSSTAGIDALKLYAMKADTRVAGPWADHPIVDPKEDPSIKGIKLWPWQDYVRRKVMEAPDNRTIHWVCNKGGRVGKSVFTKYMLVHHKAVVLSFGNAADLTNLVSKYMHRTIYLFDLPRVKPAVLSGGDMYTALESIKNGIVVNTKFHTSSETMRSPHVWVFANELPDFKCLSDDRWSVWQINKDMQLELFDHSRHRADEEKRLFVNGVLEAEAAARSAKRAKLIAEAVKLRAGGEGKDLSALYDELIGDPRSAIVDSQDEGRGRLRRAAIAISDDEDEERAFAGFDMEAFERQELVARRPA